MELTAGTQYIGTVTGMRRGVRVNTEKRFIASRDQTSEPFIRNRVTPDQDRVFIKHSHGSAPALFVTGSIKKA